MPELVSFPSIKHPLTLLDTQFGNELPAIAELQVAERIVGLGEISGVQREIHGWCLPRVRFK